MNIETAILAPAALLAGWDHARFSLVTVAPGACV